MPELIKELFEKSKGEFINHLGITGNERIIFSGRFGTGKTTFLRNYFFTDETKQGKIKREKDYNVIHIFPVNYSIAQNEDIFRYIKYDVLFEMVEQEVNFEHIDLNAVNALPFFILENTEEVVSSFVKMIFNVGKELSYVGKGVAPVIEKLETLFKKLKTYTKEKQLEISEAKQARTYLTEMKMDQRSVYEQDLVTDIIVNALLRWREGNESEPTKENILIIDDLDRIDPEHIFRILNVFAAHFDRPGKSGNKFGFDKVIVVCDISNVRHIFKAKYGQHVDFNGYIDKFYSNHIFHYDPFSVLPSTVTKLVNNLSIVDETGTSRSANRYVGDNTLLRMLLDWMIIHEQIDLRNILKLNKSVLKSHALIIGNRELPTELDQMAWTLKILCLIKGDYLSLIDCLSKDYKWPEKWTTQQITDTLDSVMDLQASAWFSRQGTIESALFTIEGELYELKYSANQRGGLVRWRDNNQISQIPIADKRDLLKSQIIETIKFLRREGLV